MKRIMKLGEYCNASYACVKDHRCTIPFLSPMLINLNGENFVCDYWESFKESSTESHIRCGNEECIIGRGEKGGELCDVWHKDGGVCKNYIPYTELPVHPVINAILELEV